MCMSSFITVVLYTIVYVSLKWYNTSATHSELPAVKVKCEKIHFLNSQTLNFNN